MALLPAVVVTVFPNVAVLEIAGNLAAIAKLCCMGRAVPVICEEGIERLEVGDDTTNCVLAPAQKLKPAA